MQQQSLRKHRQLGRAEFVLSMMADDHVLNQDLQLRRELRKSNKFLMQHLQFDDHVPEQLARGRISKRAGVGKLVNLANVMQKCARKHKVTIHAGIAAAYEVARCEQ